MNTASTEEQTALATLPPAARAAIALRTSEHEIKLRELLTNSAGIVTVTNKAGREECHRAYMVLKNARCSIVNLEDGATEDAKAFTKAVKAEALRLIAITEAEESRLQVLRDEWDAAEKARKDALIAAERERMDAIKARIQAIRDLPLQVVGKTAEQISVMIGELVGAKPDASFEEFLPDAMDARGIALEIMAKAETAQRAIEIEAESQRQEAARKEADAEQTHITEAARVAADAKEAARQRAENERVAAELAAEKQRLADIAERQRVAAEAQAKANAELKAAQDKLAAAEAAHEARVKLKQDHAEALADNAQFDAERLERDHADALAMDDEINYVAQELDAFDAAGAADARARIVINDAPADHATDVIAVTATIYDTADSAFDPLDPSDEEIIDMGAECGLTPEQWVERLRLFVAGHGGVAA